MPDHPSQEVLANGAACGNYLREAAKIWHGRPLTEGAENAPARLSYPLDYFDEDADPVFTPITEATMFFGAEELPILAWAVSPDGGSAGVVVDMRERPSRPGIVVGEGQPVTYTDCKVIQGTPNEVLPREILEKIGLR